MRGLLSALPAMGRPLTTARKEQPQKKREDIEEGNKDNRTQQKAKEKSRKGKKKETKQGESKEDVR